LLTDHLLIGDGPQNAALDYFKENGSYALPVGAGAVLGQFDEEQLQWRTSDGVPL
jgi:hypothetical protein